METIISYINNMLAPYPNTKEIEKIREQLLQNMEDKYQELKNKGISEHEAIGIVISEFGNIDEILNEIGVESSDMSDLPIVNLPIAEEFIQQSQKNSNRVGLGVGLIIVGVTLVILLDETMDKMGLDSVYSVIPLLLFVAVGVYLFITSGSNSEQYKYITQGNFVLDSSAKSTVNALYEETRPKSNQGTAMGVVLIILAVVVMLLLSTTAAEEFAVATMLLMIAGAVMILIYWGTRIDTISALLQKGNYSPKKKSVDKFLGMVAAVVFPLATAIFLVFSFVTERWDISWIIYPVVGIGYGAFSAIYSYSQDKEKHQG